MIHAWMSSQISGVSEGLDQLLCDGRTLDNQSLGDGGSRLVSPPIRRGSCWGSSYLFLPNPLPSLGSGHIDGRLWRSAGRSTRLRLNDMRIDASPWSKAACPAA